MNPTNHFNHSEFPTSTRNRKLFTKCFPVLLLFLAGSFCVAHAQMKRVRTTPNQPEHAIFKAPTVLLVNSVKNLYKNTLFMSIYHIFGPVNSGINELYGLDVSANIRLGLDYGLTDRLSVGIGRTWYNKTVDGRFKYTLLYQTENDKSPLQLSMAGDAGIITMEHAFPGSYTFSDKLGFMYMIMAARKFSDKFSLQIAPIYAHYNRVFPGEHNDYFGVSLAGRYKLTDHTALAIEYIDNIHNNDTKSALSIGLNIETGSHVFQIFLSNSQYYNPQDILRNTHDNFFAGDIHFGFDISRIFTFGAKGLHY